MNTPTKNTTEFMQDPNAPRKPIIFKPQNDKVKKCLFRIPIQPNIVKNKLWISKCPKDMLDKWKLF